MHLHFLHDMQFRIPQEAAQARVAHSAQHGQIAAHLRAVFLPRLGGEFVVHHVGATIGVEDYAVGAEALAAFGHIYTD